MGGSGRIWAEMFHVEHSRGARTSIFAGEVPNCSTWNNFGARCAKDRVEGANKCSTWNIC